jgi:hypothetical protein
MTSPDTDASAHAILGQKYAFATASLVLGIASFITLLGLEKGILAIIFGLLAMRVDPQPRLEQRRNWGRVGLILGSVQILLVLILVLTNLDHIPAVIEALQRVSLDKVQ